MLLSPKTFECGNGLNNIIFGGKWGYNSGIWISKWNTPPS